MERLQKVMAHAGVASRRESEKLIAAGRVKVNGEVVRELGHKVSNTDRIEVDQVPIYKEEPVYYVFYKPTWLPDDPLLLTFYGLGGYAPHG